MRIKMRKPFTNEEIEKYSLEASQRYSNFESIEDARGQFAFELQGFVHYLADIREMGFENAIREVERVTQLLKEVNKCV